MTQFEKLFKLLNETNGVGNSPSFTKAILNLLKKYKNRRHTTGKIYELEKTDEDKKLAYIISAFDDNKDNILITKTIYSDYHLTRVDKFTIYEYYEVRHAETNFIIDKKEIETFIIRLFTDQLIESFECRHYKEKSEKI